MSTTEKLLGVSATVTKGGAEKYHAKNQEQGKLFARERIALLLDDGSFVEEGARQQRRPRAAGRRRGHRHRHASTGAPVAIMANDSTVKAGSLGRAHGREDPPHPGDGGASCSCPLLYLVDSAGARITDQVEMFPGRRGAGRIFYNEVHLSGLVPQICLLFGPVGGRRRLHPGLLRHRHHGRRQRLACTSARRAWPRW